MSVIPQVECKRCGKAFSSLRPRCPYCGTRRVKTGDRVPMTTASQNRGTPAAERAVVNTKWQMIFGLILLAAVVRQRLLPRLRPLLRRKIRRRLIRRMFRKPIRPIPLIRLRRRRSSRLRSRSWARRDRNSLRLSVMRFSSRRRFIPLPTLRFNGKALTPALRLLRTASLKASRAEQPPLRLPAMALPRSALSTLPDSDSYFFDCLKRNFQAVEKKC